MIRTPCPCRTWVDGAAGGAWATADGGATVHVAEARAEIRAGSHPLVTVAVATRCPRSAARDWHWAVAVVVDPRLPAASVQLAVHWAVPRSCCSTEAH